MTLFYDLSPARIATALADFRVMLERHGSLILHMTVRELKDRYAGQMLGGAWAVAAPLLSMLAYVFAFTFLFAQRLGAGDTGRGYTAYVLCGLVPWLVASEIMSRAPTSVAGSANLVKQIVFPAEVLPLRVVLAGAPQFLVGIGIVVAGAGLAGFLQWRALLLLPTATLLLFTMLAGLSYVLAGIGVFIKDVREVINFCLAIGIFVHPILYPPESVPPWLNKIFAFSPLTHIIWCFRDAVIEPTLAHPWSWLISAFVALLFLTTGWRFFRMLQPTFGNAL